MRKVVKDSILAVIDKIINAVKHRDTFLLKKLSNYTIHSASIFQDDDSLSMAIVTYSLSKILDHEREIIPRGDKAVIRSFIINLERMKKSLVMEKANEFRDRMKNLFKSIKTLDKKTSDYVGEVITKSKIKKGTAMFEHGISLSQVAQRLNISLWDMMDYVGNTSSLDKEKVVFKKVIERLENTRSMFGL